MWYNSHALMKEYYTYEDIGRVPIRDLINEINYFTPKAKEIMRRQEQARLESELTGKKKMNMPMRNKGNRR